MSASRPTALAALTLLTTLLTLTTLAALRPRAPAPLTAPADAPPRPASQLAYTLINHGVLPNEGAAIPEKYEQLVEMQAYWDARLTYPTGHMDMQWLHAAAAQDKLIPSAVPAGVRTYRPGASPLTLDPTRFTSLGPQPLQTFGCATCFAYGHVSGRVNALVVDPVTPEIAYLAATGGGVWKSTDCCDAYTTWTSVTDDPLLATTAIDDLALDPNDHNTVYAGTGDLNFGPFSFGSAGIYKSTDQGAHWTVLGASVFGPAYPSPAATFPEYQAVGKVRADPRNSNTLVAGTKTGVFFSYDAGLNWSGPCATNAFSTQRQDVTGLYLRNLGSSTVVYAALGARGFSLPVQSTYGNNGANGVYSTTLPASGCPVSWTLIARANNGWPAGTGSGTPYATSGTNNKLGRIDLAYAPSAPATIYAQVQAITATAPYMRGGQFGVWRTTDGGASWQQRSGVAALDYHNQCSGVVSASGDYPQNWYDQVLAVDPNDPNVLIMGTHEIWRSTDGGATFRNLTCGYDGGTQVHTDQHALAFRPGSSSILLAGSDGGAYVSTNINVLTPTFERLNDSLNTLEFYSGALTANFANSANPGANGGAQDSGSGVYVWSGTPGPAVWQLRYGGDGMFARIEPVLGQTWYQESQAGNIVASTSGPYGPFQSARGTWNADTRSFIMPYEIAFANCPPSGCAHLIAGTNRVWESITGGMPPTSWVTKSLNLTKNTLGANSYINQLAYAPTDETTAIVGTNDGNVQYGFTLGSGAIGGATWVNVTGGNAVLPNRPILDVAISPTSPLVGYAAVGGFDANTPTRPGHVFRVTCTALCGSFVWNNKTGNLPDIPVASIVANPNYPQQVFAGTDWGLYYTNDITVASPLWYRFDNGLPRAMVWDLTLDYGATTLAVWTRGRGAYAWPLPSAPISTPTATATSTPGTPLPTNTATVRPSNTPIITPPACGPDADYTVQTTTGSMVSGTTDSGNHCDDCATTVTLPFTLTLYNHTYPAGAPVYLNSNGQVEFQLGNAQSGNTCMPNYNNGTTIHAHWDDLRTTFGGQGIFTSVTGTAPNRQWHIEWRACYWRPGSPGCETSNFFEVNFEVRLHEDTPDFEIIYVSSSTATNSVTVAVQKDQSTQFTQYSCNTDTLGPNTRLNFSLPACASTSTPTATASPVASDTPTSTNTSVPTNTSTATTTPTGTLTVTPTPTYTSTATATLTETLTPTSSAAPTTTTTATATPTASASPSVTATLTTPTARVYLPALFYNTP